ncbi:MAG: hypothetical protein JWL64_396, partial [Frankiales bacterium]|nr:hypothetical protein [Frankiales bacterium]
MLIAVALVVTTLHGLTYVTGRPEAGSSWRPVGEIVALSAAWLLANGPYEGPVLWVPLPGHGLTVADLAAAPPLLVAVVV